MAYNNLNTTSNSPTGSNSFGFAETATPNNNEFNSYSKNSELNFSDDNGIAVSSSCVSVPASDVSSLGYEFSDSNIIPSSDISGSFFESGSVIEFFAYDSQKNLLSQEYKFTDYSVTNNTANVDVSTDYTNEFGVAVTASAMGPIPTNEITLDPSQDLFNRGFDNGEVFAYYNFINYELNSTTEDTYYISEISGDRTEIRLKTNAISATSVRQGVSSLRTRLNNSRNFDEFYLSFYENNYVVAINILLEENPIEELDPSVLIKLFQPLPPQFKVEDRLYVTTKVGESVAYRVEFNQDFESFIDNANYIKGPNVNIPLQDLVNNSTTLKSYEDLITTPSSKSLDSVLNKLNQTGVTITPNYSYNTFNEFVNFSSAKQRVYNFYEKVSQIQSYQSDIDTLTTTTGSNPGVVPISQSLASLQTNITNLVKNFDGFESYLYYNSSSFAYPKTGSTYPYALLPTSSLEVDTWMGSDVENNQYYGGIILSASLYDEDNQNWLYYTIPTFITENSENNEYVEFSNMVGQSFDEVWLYTKALSERYNTTNDPESGLPLDLAAEAIKGLGFETFGNNYDNQDNFIGLTGEDNGIYVPPTGSELITDYIAINSGKIINYWNLGYSWLNYVEQINEPGFPYAIDKVSKEIYKRLYHNMAYLTKKKGTISGLRQLINIWGIPNTILRINEFGGKNRDNTDDYDLWYERYSYAYTPVANQYMASSSVKIPWMPLERNYKVAGTTLSPNIVYTTFTGTITNGGTLTASPTGFYQIDRYFTKTGNGQYGGMLLEAVNGEINLSANPGQLGVYVGDPSTNWPSFSTNGEGINYQIGDQITITGAQINALNDTNLGQGWTGTLTITLTDLNIQEGNNAYIVPDGLAFRFKTTGHPSSSYGGKFYSQSLAVKKSNGTNDQQMDWGIGLFYEDQPSGSYSGSSFSDYYNYGKLRFYMSASTADGGVQISDDIELPFFDGGWWSVLLQRDTHEDYTDNTNPTTYTLFAANKQVNGYDGNSLGWSGSVSMSSTPQAFNNGYGGGAYNGAEYDSGTSVSESINNSWNKFGTTDLDGVYVGGYVSGSNVMTEVLNEGSKIFSGSFQEFRYYSNNIAKEVFNDFVMNPESIEGNNVTGSESSFDIVNFRAPLGNELEYKFTASLSSSFITKISSSHPSITGSAPMVFTQSFINPSNNSLTSSYDFIGYEAQSTYTYSKPNRETYFLDQPSIGIRNRVSAKIQVEDGDDYGKVLSKYRSINQNYLISQSYTEDITSLEVGFSPQDEVNDDIIATYGYGVISDVLADPRFAYDSTEAYYPKLRQIANEYFKKYTEGDVWDYLRLIKYFDNSLFKAIKSYVPARTSVTTGIIIKQHMLERNRRPPVKVNPNTIIAYTPETGSTVGGQSTATGINSPISYRDLEITGSIDIATIKGSTGGVLNPYNVEATQSAGIFYTSGLSAPGNIPDQYINLIDSGGSVVYKTNAIGTPSAVTKGFRLKAPLKTRFSFSNNLVGTFLDPNTGFEFAVSSSLRGIIGTDIIMSSSLTPVNTIASSSYYEMLPEEDISLWIRGVDNTGGTAPTQLNFLQVSLLTPQDFSPIATQPVNYSSSIWNSYTTQSYIVRNDTISGSTYEIHKSQDEFYNGEFSGSTIVATTQSLLNNPFATPNNLDTSYVIAITASEGKLSPKSSITINTYPSYSIPFRFTQSTADQMDAFRGEWETYGTTNLTQQGTGSIYIVQSQYDNENFWVAGIIFPTKAKRIGETSANTLDLPELLGWTNPSFEQFDIAPLMDIPHPPKSASGMFGIQDGQIVPNSIAPYFKMDISGSINNTFWDTIAPQPVDFETQGLLGNIESNILISSFLGPNNIIDKQASSTFPISVGTATSYGLVKYWFNEPMINDARVIRINSNLPQGGGNPPIFDGVVDLPIYFSNFDLVQEEATKNVRTTSVPAMSSASLTVQGTTWTGSYGDYGNYAPTLFTINQLNKDSSGNVVDNQDTLATTPDFNFTITNIPSGTPTANDIYGLSGDVFQQSLNNVQGVYTTNVGIDNTTNYLYSLTSSRALSGSLTPQYIPSGDNPKQLLSFEPSLPNIVEFYNTPFNPLINNADNNRANTYKQVVEYDNGPIPSNLQAIIDNTAIKAEVPDSFYTQKSSILNKFVGSKLQSATYNEFTPSGSQITYLGGELSGSIISGSNQNLERTTNCFTAGTQISMADNSIKNIEDVTAGENVLAYNETININEEGTVGDISSHEVESIITITFNNGIVINTTEEHPFFVKGKGWTIASDLEISDICQDVNGNDVVISSILSQNGTYTVYNLLSISNHHNFYANEILVHNKATNITELIGTSPIYGGDSPPGTMPSIGTSVNTVAQHPIYFAHFKTSKESKELWGSYTFRIDQLIECPLEDIKGEKAPENPVVIKIDGSGNNLTEVKSTFEIDRKALVAYNQGKVIKSGSLPINYTSLKVGDSYIYQGAMEYQTIFTNQVQRNSYATTQSFISSSWANMQGYGATNVINFPSSSYYLFNGDGLGVFPSSSNFTFLTSSTDAGLYLMGGYLNFSASLGFSASVNLGSYQCVTGRGLALVNSFNQYVSRSVYATQSTADSIMLPGIPNAIKNTGNTLIQTQLTRKFDINPVNYITQDFLNSKNNNDENVTSFEDFQQNVLFQVGDEIRVDYNTVAQGSKDGQDRTQTFTVTYNGPNDDYESAPYPSDGQGNNILWPFLTFYNPPANPLYFSAVTSSIHIYDKLIVSPDPRTLEYQIPDGKIFNVTVRRRINADDRVVIYQAAPTGSNGVKSLSPSGYLIPNDFSQQQKRNVQTIINQLSAKNAFRADEDNDNRRMPIE